MSISHNHLFPLQNCMSVETCAECRDFRWHGQEQYWYGVWLAKLLLVPPLPQFSECGISLLKRVTEIMQPSEMIYNPLRVTGEVAGVLLLLSNTCKHMGRGTGSVFICSTLTPVHPLTSSQPLYIHWKSECVWPGITITLFRFTL